MLTELAIRDFAIVDHLELDLAGGMTAITGETGAGKSILLGALGLCLGERADSASVRHGSERADLSARFDLKALPEASAWLESRELPTDDCLLRRVVTRSGRSKAWINGQPATVADLRALGEHLIEIHGQHAHQALLHEETHLRLLDDFAGHRERVAEMQLTFREWQASRRRLERLAEDGDEIRARRQLLRYQVEELDTLALAEDELKGLEVEQEELAHAEERLREAQFAAECCDGDEAGAPLAERLRAEGHKVSQLHLRHIHPLNPNLDEIFARFEHILVPEINDSGLYGHGQLATLLRAKTCNPAIQSMNKMQGLGFRVKDIVTKAEKVLAGE
jgi:DNA repair protein RecN (Recombination protein N)